MRPLRTPPTRRRFVLAWLSALVLAAAALRPVPARADGGGTSPPPGGPVSGGDDDLADRIEEQSEKGWAAFRRGNHEEALARMERLAKLAPTNPLPAYLRARVLARTGKYPEALASATQAATASPADRRVEALRLDLLHRLGRDDEAATAVAASLADRPDDLVARAFEGALLEESGRRKEALASYDAVVAAYNAKDPLPEEMPWVAQAAVRATKLSPNPADDMIQGAVRLLSRYVEKNPDDEDALLRLADLFLADRGARSLSTAGKYLKQILDKNPNVPEARVGQARIALEYYASDNATKELTRALETDPSHVPAMNLLAAIHVGDGDYDKADALWKRAVEVNPKDKEARAIHAARLLVAGDKAGFAAIEKELLAQDPFYAPLYRIASDLVGERRRRFDVAADFAEKAIRTDPLDDQSYVTQGVNFLNLGREDEALARFEKAREVSKGYQDVQRENYIEILGVLKTFVVSRTPHFTVKQHVEEAAVMEPYLLPLLERGWADLSKKYGYEPQGNVLVESFHRHDDFSIRSTGSPNVPYAGVCFGSVFTLDGPFARPVGTNSWAVAAWHEFAHVITLQLSKGQVPRWLTEGLSVHEEHAHDPVWGRSEMDRMLFDRWSNGRLLKMSEINHAFHGPDIGFAYFQGGLIADYLAETTGFAAVPKMLRLYGEDKTTEQVFTEVLGMPLADFDARFAEWIGKRVSKFKAVPRWDDVTKKELEARVEKDPSDAAAWTKLAWALHQRGNTIDAGAALEKARGLAADDPDVILLEADLAAGGGRLDVAKEKWTRFLATGRDDVAARLGLAKIALAQGKDSEEAVRQLIAAKACFPTFVGRGNPYVQLAKLYEAGGEPAKAVAELEALAALAHENYEIRQQLAAWYEKKKDDDALIRVSEQMIDISPFGADRHEPPDLDLHRRLARAYARKGEKEEAAREWKVQALLVTLLPEAERAKAGLVDAHLARGDLLLELGRADEALEEALAALAVEPSSLPARALETRAREAGGGK